MMPSRRMLFFCVAVAVQLLSASSRADDKHRLAEEKFRSGREAVSHGDCLLAIELFRASNDLEPGLGKILNIAICEETLGHLVVAKAHFEEILRQLPRGDERIAITKDHLSALAERTPAITLRLAEGTPTQTVIKLDDKAVEASSLGSEVQVDPGRHVVTVICAGRADSRREVSLDVGSRLTLSLVAGAPLPKVFSSPTVDSGAPLGGRSVAGYLFGALGVAGLGAGAVMGGVAISVHDATESRCPTHRGCSQEVIHDASVGQTLSTASAVAIPAGVVLSGVGVYLGITGARSTRAANISVTVVPGGLGLQGSF